ncbi:MAG: hypothetical protein ACOYKE_08045 [Ferruginibacter sp.]
MKKILTVILLSISFSVFAQEEALKRIAFPITDYILNPSDSIAIVQIKLPTGLAITEKRLGVFKSLWSQEDTSVVMIGYGRCNLIKGDYYYFTINHAKSSRKPTKGDLIYTQIQLPNLYKGVLYGVIEHGIILLDVYEAPMISDVSVLKYMDETIELNNLQKLVDDIQFTGKTMIEQQMQDVAITEGTYKGENILAFMKNKTTVADVKAFLKYVAARPTKYAGKSWKISEIFATWVVAGAPTVIEN